MISSQGIVKIIDFGATRTIQKPYFIGTQDKHHKFYGTLGYADPSVITGKKVDDVKCEVWAVGCVLYTMLFGRFPFKDLNEIVEGEIDFEMKGIELSFGCSVMLYQLLDRDESKRPNTAEVLSSVWINRFEKIRN